MRPKRRRLAFVFLSLVVLAGGVALIAVALQENIEFFFSPSDIKSRHDLVGRDIRIGGLVAVGSFSREVDGIKRFAVTDGAHETRVVYRGLLPDLFREDQGVVIRGKLMPGGVFMAREILAKHDEQYMPPEVADALKRSGNWRGRTDIR